MGTYLLSSTLQFLQTVLQTLHTLEQVSVLLAQQTLVQFDLLQETLGGGVVVTTFVRQVLQAHIVHRFVHVGHELGD